MAERQSKSLRSRWTGTDVASLRRFLPLNAFAKNLPTSNFAIPRQGLAVIEHDGRQFLDLRGFPLALLLNLHDRGIDFSFAKSCKNEHGVDTEIAFGGCTLEDCLFDHVQTIRSMVGAFTRCTFREARIREAYLTAEFRHCVFDGSNLRAARLHHSTFTDCSFRDCDLLKSELGGVAFTRCDFRGARLGGGSILGTKFLGCNLANVDLGDAFRDEQTLFDLDCDLTDLRYATTHKVFGDEIDAGPPPVKRAAL